MTDQILREVQAEKIQKVIWQTAGIKDKEIDQNIGNARESNLPCCVGAHLCNMLNVKNQTRPFRPDPDYLAGAQAWAQLMGGNILHAVILLREAGAGYDPFGINPWDSSVAAVWDNLSWVEELPDLRNRTFDSIEISECDLRSADLEGCSFRGTLGPGVIFRHANLKNCVFVQGTFDGATFAHADIDNAIFEMAELDDTDWYKTKNTRTARFDGASMEGAAHLDRPQDDELW